MRRLIPAAVLSVFLIVSGTLGFFITKNSCQKTNRLVELCEQSLSTQEKEEIEYAVEKLYNDWDKTSRLLAVFSAHDIIDKISYKTARIKGACVSGQYGEMVTEFAEIRRYLIQLEDEQKFGLECFY